MENIHKMLNSDVQKDRKTYRRGEEFGSGKSLLRNYEKYNKSLFKKGRHGQDSVGLGLKVNKSLKNRYRKRYNQQ